MAWEERSLVEAMYANDTVSWLDINGNIYDFNSRSLAEGSPELVNRFPTVCNEHKWSARQQMVNRIVTEVFYHCPAEWTASALAGSDSKTWRYEVRHEQNLHGDDLQMTLPSSSDFDLEDEKWLSRAGIAYALQRMWGKFITQDTPVISLHDAHYSNRHAVVPVSSGNAEKNTSDTLHWPQYPWMVVLDSEGGQTEIEKPLGQDFRCPVRIGPDDEEELYLNRFSLANSVTWNKDRGARCRWWQENGHKIPL